MKKLKSIIIYGILVLLCVFTVVGYFMNKPNSVKEVSVNSNNISTLDSVNSTKDTDKIESTTSKHIDDVMTRASAEPESNPLIGIGLGDDYSKVTNSVIENAGSLKDIIKEGNTVLIKPNLCTSANPNSPLITDYRVVNEVVKQVKEYGASKVIIADGAILGNSLSDNSLEMNKYNTIQGVEFININDVAEKDCYELKPQKSLTGKALFIPKVYMDADVVITVAKLKTHFQPDAVVTLSLKNSFGATSGMVYGGSSSKSGLHQLGLKESILDINRIRRPDFAIIEGIVGGEGYGPLYNEPVKSNIMFAGKDLVALDTVALTFMGFKVDQVPHVKLAGEENMGITDLNKIVIKGADLDAIKMVFKR